jgi:hypothetical protein
MDQKCEELKKKLEAECMEKLKNGPILSEKEWLALLQKGGEEFKAQMGRPMTYGEIREIYG